MNKSFIKKIYIIFSFIFIFAGCKSIPEKEQEFVYVMVYDFENHALMNVEILCGESLLSVTDIYGRATVPVKNISSKGLSFRKDGYENLVVNDISDKEQVLYVKLASHSYYADLSEKMFDEKKYEKALFYINKALEIQKRKDYEYLKIKIEGQMNEE